jgi:hypothetical protein
MECPAANGVTRIFRNGYSPCEHGEKDRMSEDDAITRVLMMERIARVAHEANRAWCKSLGDDTQLPWDEAPDWQQNSAIVGVEFHIANPFAGSDASHNAWMAQKEHDGWVYGAVKDAKAKTHPCMVPFDRLPREQQIKDNLFRHIVHALRP